MKPSDAPRKTLDDIRRELEAAYPSTPDERLVEPPAQAPETVSANLVSANLERPRAASGRRAQRRGYVTAAVLGGAAGVLLVAVYATTTGNSPRFAGRAADQHRIDTPAQPSAAVLAAAPTRAVDEQLNELRAELRALAARLERSESRIGGVESRFNGVESSMRRGADDASSAVVSRRAERAVPESRPRARKPTVIPLQPAPAPPGTATDSEGALPSRSTVREMSQPADDPPPLVASAPTTPSSPPRPQTEPVESVRTNVAAADDGPRSEASAPENAPPTSAPRTVGEMVREEWRTIKQTLKNVGQDLKTGMRGLARKVGGE
jgi:hypothetical protein